ncbi:hypothetical protein ACJMK2_015559, partial [Sinanodonta woodiana]
RYCVREPPTKFVVATVVTEEHDDNAGLAEVLPSCPLTKEENYVDVALDVTLTSDQRKELESVLQEHASVLTEKPGKTDLEDTLSPDSEK